MVRISIIAVLSMLMTACFAGSPVSPSAVISPDVCGDKAPVVTRGSLGRTSETDPVILARRVLGIPGFSGDGLTDEIARVLGIIRSTWPEMVKVNARPRWEPGTLILRLEPSLFKAVSLSLPEEDGVSALFCTGHPEFDALNAAVGLRGVEIFPLKYVHAVEIRFDPREHIYSAGASYEKIEGVIYARPVSVLGDSSDIEALWSDGKWYVVFRRAWGDCPSGCIFSELHFFVEHGGEVERTDLERATGIEEFAEILAKRGWIQRLERQ
ncbi:MAG: hypothetical protein F4X55_05530 [Candidatus Dadabacteria bacterium]|nr:hypothetical protein [Candidatus Dadabacteria bacterium]MYC40455.1 hypothetical protein [Candidatus Dadabacteria bacterium]